MQVIYWPSALRARRAWVVGARHPECPVGFRGRPLGGLFEQVVKPSWGIVWGPLGASFGTLRGFLGPLGGRLGASGFLFRLSSGVLGLSRGGRLIFRFVVSSWAFLGTVLGRSWVVSGSWGHRGHRGSWAHGGIG